MNNNSVFVLSLIGSILGILVSILWLIFGTMLLSGFIVGIMELMTQEPVAVTGSILAPGFLIAFFQSGITIAAFIVSIVKGVPGKLKKNLKSSGFWILGSGIIALVINPIQTISSILLIIAGSIAIKNAGDEDNRDDEPYMIPE